MIGKFTYLSNFDTNVFDVTPNTRCGQAFITIKDSILNGGGTPTLPRVYYDAIVAPTGGDYTTLKQALDAGEKYIFVRNGLYANTPTLKILTDGVEIIGESKKDTIIQFAAGVDGIAYYANNTYTTNITLDGETNNAGATFIIGDGLPNPNVNIGNNNVVENCIIKGANNTFAIYIAGPSYSSGLPALQGLEDNLLSVGNVVRNCELHSGRDGDAFSFSLQKNGSFDNNICYSGRIAFYMTRNSSCSFNKSVNSLNQGIFMAGPSYDNVVIGNSIFGAASSGIKLQNQLEHTPLLPGQGIIGNTISNNNFTDCGVNGIEISGEVNNPIHSNTFVGNTTNGTGNHGIYLQEATNNIIKGNSISNPRRNTGGRGSGIYMVSNVKDNIIEGNTINGIAIHTAISNREDNSCTGNIVKGNIVKGTNTERTIWFESDENIIEGNSMEGGNYAGIRLNNASLCQVIGNKCKNNTNDANNAFAEIRLQGSSSNNTISTNTLISTAGNKMANGINIDGAGCQNNRIIQNVTMGNISSAINDTGSGTIIV